MSSHRRFVLAIYLVIAGAWIAARMFVFAHASPISFPDSASYVDKAAEPLWTRDFFFGSGRFFVVPLFYKAALLKHGPVQGTLTRAQFAFSLVAWLVFASALAARYRRPWVSILFFTLVLALGLSASVTQWDFMILSESVSTSLLAILMAMWIRLSNGLTTTKTVATLAIAFAWSMSREANSLLLAPLAVVVSFWGVWYLRPHTLEKTLSAVLGGGLLGIVVATFAISASGDRWMFPLLNVIGKRVLPTPEKRAFFQAHGMPVNSKLLEMSGEWASGKNWAFYSAPELADFRAWLTTQGRRVYTRDLVMHPLRSLAEPVEDIDQFVCPTINQYWSPGFRPIYTVSDQAWFCGARAALVIVTGSLLTGLGFIAAAYAFRRRLHTSDGFSTLTIGALFVGWLPFTWFVWHVIGGMEIGRHEVSGILMFRVGLVLLVAYTVDSLAHLRNARLSAPVGM